MIFLICICIWCFMTWCVLEARRLERRSTEAASVAVSRPITSENQCPAPIASSSCSS